MSIANNCSIQTCNRGVHAKGYCTLHYQRIRTGKSLDDPFNCIHGYSTHYLYTTWEAMKQRCLNKNSSKYHRYGGRGITICNDWLSSKNYIEYIDNNLGEKPSSNHTIDRIDNNKGYEPGNVRWATKKEQIANTRIRSDNRVGVKGVSWDNSRSKWVLRLTLEGKYKYIGRFNTKEEAIRVSQSYKQTSA